MTILFCIDNTTNKVLVQSLFLFFSIARGHYIAAWYAAQMMVPAKQGLIINVSSMGGLNYVFNAAYGVGKAAVCLSLNYFTPKRMKTQANN